MTDQLRKEILEIVSDLASRIDSLSFNEISNLSEELLDRAMLAEFLALRASRKSAIQQKLQRAIGEASLNEEMEKPEIKEHAAPSEPEENPFPMNPEIKVVPHPEGPPLPRQEHESPTEKIEVAAQPQEPEAIPVEEKPASIAEKAQQSHSKKSLHDRLAAKNLSFGLNDRLAFVKNLFDGSAEDFNRVVSQLNTFSSWEEADVFINEMVKPDYDWGAKPEFADRFIDQVKMRFES